MKVVKAILAVSLAAVALIGGLLGAGILLKQRDDERSRQRVAGQTPEGDAPRARAPGIAFALYRTVYRWAAWLLAHTGPFSPFLSVAAYKMHQRLRPKGYFTHLPNPIETDGLVLYHDNIPSTFVQALAMGTLERETVAAVTDVVEPGMTVLDVGAHIGYFTMVTARLVGDQGTVWAFEALPDSCQVIEKNANANGFAHRVHVVCAALTETPGTLTMMVDECDSGSSSAFRQPAVDHHTIDVPATTLDTWGAEHGWPTVDVVKMDIEGAEIGALRGMVELSRRNAHMVLLIEFNPPAIQAAGCQPHDFSAALDACGFRHITIAGQEETPIHLPHDIPRLVGQTRWTEILNLVCRKDV